MALTGNSAKRQSDGSGLDFRTYTANSKETQAVCVHDPDSSAGSDKIQSVVDANAAPYSGARAALVQSCPARSSVTTLINGVWFDSAGETNNSSSVDSSNYRYFALYLLWWKAGTGSDNVEVQVRFSPDGGTTWFDLVRMPFGDLRQSIDSIGANGQVEVIDGPCVGPLFQVTCVGSSGLNSTNKIQLTAKVQFYN